MNDFIKSVSARKEREKLERSHGSEALNASYFEDVPTGGEDEADINDLEEQAKQEQNESLIAASQAGQSHASTS